MGGRVASMWGGRPPRGIVSLCKGARLKARRPLQRELQRQPQRQGAALHLQGGRRQDAAARGRQAHGDRRDALGASMVGLSGVGGDVGGGGSYAGAYYEPEGVATEASPEGASFGGGDGGVAFAG